MLDNKGLVGSAIVRALTKRNFKKFLTIEKSKLDLKNQPGFKSFLKKIHSFDWVDDLAALGSLEARRFAQNWLSLWMAKYSSGSGPVGQQN